MVLALYGKFQAMTGYSKGSGHFCLMWDSSHGQSLLQNSPLGQPTLCQTCITVWGSSCSHTRFEELTSISLKMCSLDSRNFFEESRDWHCGAHISWLVWYIFQDSVFTLSKGWMHSRTKQLTSAVQISRHSHIAQETNKSLEKCDISNLDSALSTCVNLRALPC